MWSQTLPKPRPLVNPYERERERERVRERGREVRCNGWRMSLNGVPEDGDMEDAGRMTPGLLYM